MHFLLRNGILFVCIVICASFAYCQVQNRSPHHCQALSLETKLCDVSVSSKALFSDIHVKLYGPSKIDWDQLPVVIFLHGRGANSGFGKAGQILSLGLQEWMSTAAYRKHPFVVAAPQDHFVHEAGSTGQDYWLGTINSGRDWEHFLRHELLRYLQQKHSVGMSHCDRVIAGISMGAHGALRAGLFLPQKFAAVGAHSPIFRVNPSDVQVFDQDVFGSEQQLNIYKLRSFGYAVVHQQQSRFLPAPVFMDIGSTDSLLLGSYSSGQQVWQILRDHKEQLQGTVIRQGVASNGESGHNFRYWKAMALDEYFPWYVQQMRRCHYHNRT